MTPPPDAPMTTNGTDLLAATPQQLLAWWLAPERPSAAINALPELRDAIVAAVRAQAPAPVAGAELSEEQVRVDWSRGYFTAGRRSGEWPDLFTDERDFVMDFARRIFARGIASAQAPSLLEARREGWDAARDWFHPDLLGQWTERFDAERDRRFPLPAPAGITLSDGSVVTWHANIFDDGGWERRYDGRLISTSDLWREMLTEPTDTGDDFNKLKAYAAEQSEAR